MQRLLDEAVPMVSLLWRRETEGRVFDSPERKATLDKTLRAALSLIKDPSIRGHYGEEIKQLRWELFGARRPVPRKKGDWKPGGRDIVQAPLASTKSSLLAGPPDDRVTERLREAMILATLMSHPGLLRRFEPELERVEFSDPGYGRLCAAMLRHAGAPDFHAKVAAEAGVALEALMSLAHVQIAPPVRNTADTALATMCLAEELAKLEAGRGVQKEIEDAAQDLDGLADEGVTWRLGQAAEARNRAGKSTQDDAKDLGEDRAALSRHLQSLIDAEVWVKKKG